MTNKIYRDVANKILKFIWKKYTYMNNPGEYIYQGEKGNVSRPATTDYSVWTPIIWNSLGVQESKKYLNTGGTSNHKIS